MGTWGGDYRGDLVAGGSLENFRAANSAGQVIRIRSQGDFHDGMMAVPATQYEICFRQVCVFFLGNQALLYR